MPQKKKGNEKSEKKGVRAELKPSDDRTAKTLVMMELKDVIHHEKNGKGSVILFGVLRSKDDEKLGTVNLNINNLDKAGMKAIANGLGHKVAMGLPMTVMLEVPQGATLDDWEEAMSKKDVPESDGSTEQSTLPEGPA